MSNGSSRAIIQAHFSKSVHGDSRSGAKRGHDAMMALTTREIKKEKVAPDLQSYLWCSSLRRGMATRSVEGVEALTQLKAKLGDKRTEWVSELAAVYKRGRSARAVISLAS